MKALRRILAPRAGRAAALALVVAFGASAASASEVVPAFLVREVLPGRTETLQIVLRTKLPFERVFLNPVDFSIDRKGMLNTEEPRDKRYSAKSWIRFRPVEMILLKGRDYPVDLPVLVPSGTPGGEFYAGVEITTVQKETPATKGMNVKVEVSMLALFVLRIKGGTPKVAGELVDPIVTVKDSTPHFSAVFHSLSTVAVVARAGVLVRGADQKTVDQVLLLGAGTQEKDGQVFMLPDAYREFAGQGNRKLPAGKYQADLIAYFGKRKVRTVRQVAFEVAESDVPPPPPLADVTSDPDKLVLELPSGGVKYPVVEFKNRGFNAVAVKLSSDFAGVSFFPEELTLQPGKSGKVRVGVRLPPAENPQRTFMLTLTLQGGAEGDRKDVVVAVYAPGTAPKKEEGAGGPPRAQLPTEGEGAEPGERTAPSKKP